MDGLYVHLTHGGLRPTSIYVADIKDFIGDIDGWKKPGPIYVPVGGSVDVEYTTTVAKSFENGAIRKFVQNGELRADLLPGNAIARGVACDIVAHSSFRDDMVENLIGPTYMTMNFGTGTTTYPPLLQNGVLRLDAPAVGDVAQIVGRTISAIGQNLESTFGVKVSGAGIPADVNYIFALFDFFAGGLGWVVDPGWVPSGNWGIVVNPPFGVIYDTGIPIDGLYHEFAIKTNPTTIGFWYDGGLVIAVPSSDAAPIIVPATPLGLGVAAASMPVGAGLAALDLDYLIINQNRVY